MLKVVLAHLLSKSAKYASQKKINGFEGACEDGSLHYW